MFEFFSRLFGPRREVQIEAGENGRWRWVAYISNRAVAGSSVRGYATQKLALEKARELLGARWSYKRAGGYNGRGES